MVDVDRVGFGFRCAGLGPVWAELGRPRPRHVSLLGDATSWAWFENRPRFIVPGSWWTRACRSMSCWLGPRWTQSTISSLLSGPCASGARGRAAPFSLSLSTPWRRPSPAVSPLGYAVWRSSRASKGLYGLARARRARRWVQGSGLGSQAADVHTVATVRSLQWQ
jgi:hypothetical protein